MEGKIHTERAIGFEVLAGDSKTCEKQSMDKSQSILSFKCKFADSESTNALLINSGTHCLHDTCNCACSDYAGDQQEDTSKSDLGERLLASDRSQLMNSSENYTNVGDSELLSDNIETTEECCNALMKGELDDTSSKRSDECADCDPKIEKPFIGDSSSAKGKSNNRKEISSCDLEMLLENFLCEEIIESGVRCLDEHYKQIGVSEMKNNRSNQTATVSKSEILYYFDPEENGTEIMRVKEKTTNGEYLLTGVSKGSFPENSSYASSKVNVGLDNTSVSCYVTHQTSENAGLDEDREVNEKDVNMIIDGKVLPIEISNDSEVDSVFNHKQRSTAEGQPLASENKVVFKPHSTRKQRKDPNKLLCTCVQEESHEQRARQSSLIREIKFLQSWNNAYNSQVAWLHYYRRQFKTF